ncbi:MAG: hypothetical protein IPH48_22320 [bacterium]|nr:hypothetical protein [bacterium]
MPASARRVKGVGVGGSPGGVTGVAAKAVAAIASRAMAGSSQRLMVRTMTSRDLGTSRAGRGAGE